MSLYAVKNDKGEYLNGVAGEKPLFGGLDKYCVLNGKDAGWWACRGYGKVVELVEKSAPVVVSEAEAEMLKWAKKKDAPAWIISTNSADADEDRLMRAYVNGWEVEKPKQYGVWVPHVKGKMYYKDGRGSDDLDIASADFLNDKNQRFTLAEIEHYELTDCERMEVTDDGE
ncbi:DUF1642 domain-containing protein [Lacticaseibacillus suilingensis]|uniref:DUF1642 domain-containing protein n=1 Tax=Lacticaseibacillus suilingensis TaxID=2799577 RepID=UPI0022E4671F|nr:DUF1642 domain-containing protein [Lacticaseibacillus suilingensis]